MNDLTQPEQFLPLTEASYFILLSLAHGPAHGYGILKSVKNLSEGRITLSAGTLYGALKRLLEDGWIERLESDEGAGGRERKFYRLTGLGGSILSAETHRLQALVRAAARLPGALTA
jgi:DNA-binding PadR family transcriptional regulator